MNVAHTILKFRIPIKELANKYHHNKPLKQLHFDVTETLPSLFVLFEQYGCLVVLLL